MNEHGLRVFAGGIVLHGDGRRRYWSEQGIEEIRKGASGERGPRGKVTALTKASWRRLELIVASAANGFRSMVTLTYRAPNERWETDGERNARIVERSKRDLNRFLSALRSRLGAYIWVLEFQERGVVHYHLLCEHAVEQHAATVAWLRAIGTMDDPDAIQHGVLVEEVKSQRGARWYLGKYLGKLRQKFLPEGVAAAGRWWGRSRSLQLEVLADAVVLPKDETVPHWVETRVVRSTRRFLSGHLRFRYRGGLVIDWSGKLAVRAAMVMARLSEFYTANLPEGLRQGGAS